LLPRDDLEAANGAPTINFGNFFAAAAMEASKREALPAVIDATAVPVPANAGLADARDETEHHHLGKPNPGANLSQDAAAWPLRSEDDDHVEW